MFNEDDRVGTSEGQPETSYMRRQQQAVDTRIGVECLNGRMALIRIDRTIKSHISDFGHQSLEEVGLDHLNHLLHLAEDKNTMAGEGATGIDKVLCFFILRTSDAAVVQELSRSINGSVTHERTDH